MKLRIQATALAATLALATLTAPAQAATFQDVPKSHYAYEAIDVLSDKGIVGGYPDGTYGINQPVTRAQAAKIIALAAGMKPSANFQPDFQDVSPAHGSYQHIRALTERGIFNNSEHFNPNAPLTRGQMAKIITLAYDIIVDDNDLITFRDVNRLNGYKGYITTIAELGITTTAQGEAFKPNDDVTRAQMAAFVKRAMDFDAKRKSGEIYYDKTQQKYVDKTYSIPEPPPAVKDDTFAADTIKLVNKERASQKLAALKVDTALNKIAQTKAEDMVKNNYFAHLSPTYGSVGTMLDTFKYSWTAYGENIAKGYTSPNSAVEGWMSSKGHRANILQSKFTNIGAGYSTDADGTTYWVHIFTAK
ncbi:S-layer homology domain-containing protein [Sporosarcina sp. Te-1]|uniref:CAP and S-layer homology domain-containing protein n=1 Tax=Sporosarcina sp. Te-1 TaxID=2818390 RepID=UPI001A9E85E8|nr:S-layer homology domain-containing protein [Sporosarcina sp. Te-1]QTD40800.1 S-layer homology domain-containing protein [Sporosarcina sp. Te-1]